MPEFPMAFWGTVTLNGTPASVGTLVRAYYGNQLVGEITVQESGIYGYTETEKQKLLIPEGNGTIVFQVQSTPFNNGVETKGNSFQSYSGFESGLTVQKDLVFTLANPVSSGGGGGGSSSGGGGGSTTPRPATPVVTTSTTLMNTSVTVPTTDNILCPAGQLLNQNLKTGARNGRYHSYTKAIVTEAGILQGHLNRLGFNAGKIDGILGPITEGAIKRMQTFLDTKADGYVGPITRNFLNSSCK